MRDKPIKASDAMKQMLQSLNAGRYWYSNIGANDRAKQNSALTTLRALYKRGWLKTLHDCELTEAGLAALKEFQTIPFNAAEKCSPTATQCPRCNNPWNRCDRALGTIESNPTNPPNAASAPDARGDI